MKRINILFVIFLVSGWSHLVSADKKPTTSYRQVSEYDVIFNTPSKDEADSIPMGNGTTGINLWVEENGDLLFYISRNDAISEMHRLLKLGRVRVSLSPNPFEKGKPYHQQLNLVDGVCEITAGKNQEAIKIKVWLDSDSQVIYVTGDSQKPRQIKVALENWRTETNVLEAGEIGSTWIYRTGIPNQLTPNSEAADLVLDTANTIQWSHRNAHTPVPIHIEQMRLLDDKKRILDPIARRTFGGVIWGKGFVSSGKAELTQKNSPSFEIRIATESLQVKTTQGTTEFDSSLKTIARQSVEANTSALRTRAWWNSYWKRSWIFVKESTGSTIPDNKHAIHFGAGRDGQLPIGGEQKQIAIHHGALSPEQIKKNATSLPKPTLVRKNSVVSFSKLKGKNYFVGEISTDIKFPQGFTLEAMIQPAQQGRIFDKITPGGTDGFLFDIASGKLRFIVGAQTAYSTQPIPMNQWSHVAAICSNTGHLEIYLNGKRVDDQPALPEAPMSQVTQAYILTKYQFACQQRSIFPSHFNGGIFTMAPEFAYYATDPRGKNWSADYRFYGPNFWWQNTRFMYQLHLAQGNDDLLDSFFDFYFRNIPSFQSMAKRHYGADGIFMYETITHFGLPGMGDFGWNQKAYSEPYTKDIWQQALELGAFALDRYDYTQDREFFKKAIYWCDQSLRFYDTRFKKDNDGKIIIFPSHSVETYWHGVQGDMPSIAGLHEITSRLLKLPHDTTTAAQRKQWTKIAQSVPDLPKRKDAQGDIVPDVAQKYDPKRSNYEAPKMYGIYPFRLYGLNRMEHDIEEGRRAWHTMINKGHCCWYQTGIFAARLGMAEQAAEDVLIRTGKNTRLKVVDFPNRYFRFPGFYSSPHDWCPDYDGAGNMANTLQEMLVHQGDGDTLLLLPAWPSHWDVHFKLHAPQKTLIEVDYQGGKLLKLHVTPESRRKDIILPEFLK